MDEKELKRAKSIAYRLLEYRGRSEKELTTRLKSKKVSGRVIAKVITDLKKVCLVDDKEFARALVAERINRGYGPQRIARELKAKGITESLVRRVIPELCDKQRIDNLMDELIKSRVKRYRGKPPAEIKRKLYSYLSVRGFSFDEIERALEDIESIL
ncbi:regulatory protein RecX [Candidatus Omnitrophota bacterium]